MRAKCFSAEDRVLLAERVRKNETGIQNREFKAITSSDFYSLRSPSPPLQIYQALHGPCGID
jgi:hypothetical protein